MGKRFYSVSYQVGVGDFPSTNVAMADSAEQVEARYREHYVSRYGRLNYLNVCEIPEHRFEEYRAKPGMPIIEV